MTCKTLVFGDGLLGSKYKGRPDTVVISHAECDITSWYDVRATMEHHTPSTVINCAGMVPKAKTDKEMDMVKANALGPHILYRECERQLCHFVQVSTDCVFDGKSGWNSEIDMPNASSVYGISKWLGEQTEFPHLTVRASFVGIDDPKGRGLLHWAQNTSDIIVGYDKVIWNGVTTKELVAKLDLMITENRTGLYHIHSKIGTTKHQLLVDANEIFGWGKTIIAQSSVVGTTIVVENRLLSSLSNVGVVDKLIKDQLKELV